MKDNPEQNFRKKFTKRKICESLKNDGNDERTKRTFTSWRVVLTREKSLARNFDGRAGPATRCEPLFRPALRARMYAKVLGRAKLMAGRVAPSEL